MASDVAALLRECARDEGVSPSWWALRGSCKSLLWLHDRLRAAMGDRLLLAMLLAEHGGDDRSPKRRAAAPGDVQRLERVLERVAMCPAGDRKRGVHHAAVKQAVLGCPVLSGAQRAAALEEAVKASAAEKHVPALPVLIVNDADAHGWAYGVKAKTLQVLVAGECPVARACVSHTLSHTPHLAGTGTRFGATLCCIRLP